jgi:hypothetical protein
VKYLVLFALVASGCAAHHVHLEGEAAKEAMLTLGDRLFWLCFLENDKDSPRKIPGLPEAATATMQYSTNAEGRVLKARILDANFTKRLVEPCLKKTLPGLLVAKGETAQTLGPLFVKFRDHEIEYQLDGAEGFRYQGTTKYRESLPARQ